MKVFIEELWLFQNDLNDTLDTKNPKMALARVNNEHVIENREQRRRKVVTVNVPPAF